MNVKHGVKLFQKYPNQCISTESSSSTNATQVKRIVIFKLHLCRYAQYIAEKSIHLREKGPELDKHVLSSKYLCYY